MGKRIPPFLTIMLVLAALVPAVSAAPLTVHPSNPRYFTDGSGKAIYLTGSHTWGNLYDYAPPAAPFDFDGFLNLLTDNGHNFFRMWANHGNDGTSPVPWTKTNGKYNLDILNQGYFDRLRTRVIAARDRGIYVGIILFRPDNAKLGDEDWGVDPFNGVDSYDSYNNNNNYLSGDTNNDGRGWEAYDGSISGILNVQQAYVRKVIDTTYDLDNVIYEIANEAPSISANKQWQYNMIDYIKNYESTTYGKNHPVWMSAIFAAPGEDWTPDDSFMTDSNCHADVVSPGSSSYKDSPPQNAGAKPIIADIDHIWPNEPQPAWIWKAFTRGLMPIHMDSFTYSSNPGSGISDQDQIDIRKYMGYTLTYANKMDLASMTPQNSLSSTAYCLANPGSEYLVYQPGSGSFTVNLQAGTYSYEWFNPASGTVAGTESITASAGSRSFTPPFSGDAVLYLKAGSAEPYCGDVSCNGQETCSSCPQDCGQCPSSNPIAHWRLDETSGTTASDSSGNGNTGTLVNGPAWTTGKINGGLSFDGTNDYVNIADHASLEPSIFSISLWVKFDTLTSFLIEKRPDSGGSRIGFELYRESGTGTFWFLYDEDGIGGTLNVESITQPTTDRWYHLVITRDGSGTNRIYVDGVQENSGTRVGGIASDSDLFIGSEGGVANFLDGTIDDVRIYSRALSSQEILSLYQSGTCIHESDSSCDGCVDMNELNAFIDRWKVNNQDVTLKELIEAIGFWKRGGC